MAPLTFTASMSARAEVGPARSAGKSEVPLTITRIVKVLLNVCVTLNMMVATTLGRVVSKTMC